MFHSLSVILWNRLIGDPHLQFSMFSVLYMPLRPALFYYSLKILFMHFNRNPQCRGRMPRQTLLDWTSPSVAGFARGLVEPVGSQAHDRRHGHEVHHFRSGTLNLRKLFCTFKAIRSVSKLSMYNKLSRVSNRKTKFQGKSNILTMG